MPRPVRSDLAVSISLVFALTFVAADIAKADDDVTIESDATWARHTIDNSSRGADGVRLRDVNGDGLPDIATGWEEGGVIRVYLHPGYANAKQPWPAVTVGAVKSPEDAVLVDLDSDGAFDVVSSCEGRVRTMFFHWAPGRPQRFLDPAAWTTQPITVTKEQQSWMFALPMDVDNRHGVDLIVGSKGTGAESAGWNLPQMRATSRVGNITACATPAGSCHWKRSTWTATETSTSCSPTAKETAAESFGCRILARNRRRLTLRGVRCQSVRSTEKSCFLMSKPIREDCRTSRSQSNRPPP